MLSASALKGPSGSKCDVEAQLLSPIDSQTIEQTMERLPNGIRRLAAQLRTSAKVDSLWSVLSDYENLSDFIPNLSSSSVVSREDNKVRLKQIGSQRLMGFTFSAEVHLELREDKEAGLMEFHLLKGDFRRFEGSWLIKDFPERNESFLLYELTVQGCIGMPVSLIEARLREDLNNNLLAVEAAAKKLEAVLKTDS